MKKRIALAFVAGAVLASGWTYALVDHGLFGPTPVEVTNFDNGCGADMATQAAGCAGEVENLVEQYVAERGINRRASGDSERV